MPVTRPDPDKLADLAAIDAHAEKLVGAKALKDWLRFDRLVKAPLSLRETAGALAGGALALALMLALLVVLLR